ncbi:MAG: hypothetical protein EOO47_16335, partial [Flavobacterium sp.]
MNFSNNLKLCASISRPNAKPQTVICKANENPTTMNTLKNKRLLKPIKLLAYYEIIGGVLGLLILTYFTLTTSPIQLPLLIALSIGAIFFLFSIISGQQLLYGNLTKALNLSLITQMLQLISFAVSGYALLLVSGLMISVGLELT